MHIWNHYIYSVCSQEDEDSDLATMLDEDDASVRSDHAPPPLESLGNSNTPNNPLSKT